MANTLEPGRWKWAPHLEILDRYMQDAVENGKRLIVEIPVRHGKSEYCSHWTPLWFLERWPEKRVVLTTYEATFAANWGRRTRSTALTHQRRLSMKPSRDVAAAYNWETTKGGGMLTAGVGGPITGRGADLLILDDPIKNAEEAASATRREHIWEWWTSTAYTRLEPGAAAVILMARWHPDDIAGRLQADAWNSVAGAAEWEVVNLPAIAEEGRYDMLGRKPGQALWPARYDEAALNNIKATVGSKVWNSLFQQRPRKTEGNLFKREWFEIVPQAPVDAKYVRAWDLAASDTKKVSDPDYTVGLLIGEKDGRYWIADEVRTRSTPKGVKDVIRNTAMMDGRQVKVWMWQDPGQAGKDQIDDYQREVLKGFSLYTKVASKNKVVYADPVSTAAQAGNVSIVEKPWNKGYIEELEDFPTGSHDDQVDATSLGFLALSGQQVVKRAPQAGSFSSNYWTSLGD